MSLLFKKISFSNLAILLIVRCYYDIFWFLASLHLEVYSVISLAEELLCFIKITDSHLSELEYALAIVNLELWD